MLPHGTGTARARYRNTQVLRMLGIDDPWILGVYLLCIFSTLLCVVYGVVNWNRGGETEALEIKEEAAWEEGEEEMQEKELGM